MDPTPRHRWLDTKAPNHFPAFHVMAKPIGPICNLDCRYCYYLRKEQLYPERKGMAFSMPDEVLEEHIRQYMSAQTSPVITFAWQGGEPTLLGIPFFKRALALQSKYRPAHQQVENSLQTNGTLLDDEWGRFLSENGFLVGISIDGPPDVHDCLRYDKGGHPSHEKVIRGLRVLQRHQVPYNVLTTVNSHNVRQPLRVYRYLKELGASVIQFIPIVEQGKTGSGQVTADTVPAVAYGEFLCSIFDEWVRHDVGSVFVQIFDNTLAIWSGLGSSLCVFAETCGAALALEHNGDLYSCDHFVSPEWRLGNIRQLPMVDLVNSARQIAFGEAKRDTLPGKCRRCEVRFACNGECPKNRFLTTPEGEPGLNYLCSAYLRFYRHVRPAMDEMAVLVANHHQASEIMETVKSADLQAALRAARPNAECPCGSGRKFKRCHGA